MNDKLIDAINEIANLDDSDKTNIKGKFYTTVDKRLQTFRKYFGSNANIQTQLIHHDNERVVVMATVYLYVDGKWREIGNDFAEEYRGQGMVNKTSALENCTTSAIGRALACCGLGGGEYASSFEVDNAINNKAEAPKPKYKLITSTKNAAPITTCHTEKELLEACRKFLSNPKDASNQDMYKANAMMIKEARNSSSDNDVFDSFTNLIDLYESDTDESIRYDRGSNG